MLSFAVKVTTPPALLAPLGAEMTEWPPALWFNITFLPLTGVPLAVLSGTAIVVVVAPPASTDDGFAIRSLAYFTPVIEEVLQLQVGPEYFQYLRHKLQRAASAR